ncbi:MAG: PEGA domain-containing protein [Cyanobacteria bacterium]|nr:PEGA domain-containing protein [Cyanobacteriota bacterium]
MQDEVRRLKSEVTSLKLEIATLSSALRELQNQPGSHRSKAAKAVVAIEPPSRASMTPAAIVVLLAAGLLSWQVIATPRVERASVRAEHLAPLPVIKMQELSPAPVAVEMTSPISPVGKPTIYKGTLAVKSDRPGATVFVNRKAVGAAPVRVDNLRAGSHLVWVESDGYRRWSRVVTVPAETVTRVTADLEPDVEP